jgi:cytochrome c biogenesis protein CcdA
MLQARFAALTSGTSNAGQTLLAKLNLEGWTGQFAIGLVLGAVWSPCVGPTLGAAITLASQGRDLAKITLLMAFFGLGAGTPMLILGALSRTTMMRFRSKLMSAGSLGKTVFGGIVIVLGVFTLTGLDKSLETLMVAISPEWLTNITTRF